MDAVGLERAVVFGGSEGGQMACMFAAQYPERTTALVTWGAMARWRRTPDHPWGLTDEENDELLLELLATSTVRELTAGAQLAFDDRGLHELKGVPDARRLYAVG